MTAVDFERSCGVLVNIVNDLGSVVRPDCIYLLLLYGGVLENGCRRGGDIDLLMIVYDGCPVDQSVVSKILDEYYNRGYPVSLSILPLSETVERVLKGDSLITKAVAGGYPLLGVYSHGSLKKLLERLSPFILGGTASNINRDALFEWAHTLLRDARALVNIAARDLYSACGHVKTAAGYLVAAKTGLYDPENEKAVKAGRGPVALYQEVSRLCKSALKGRASPDDINRIIDATERALRESAES